MDFSSFPSGTSLSSMMMDITDDEQGFDEAFDPPAPEEYECPVCLLVINKPVQTECGHRFCRACIMRVLREGRRNCPIDNEELNETQIYPDNFARREINMLNVHCRNWDKTNPEVGCKWLGPLKDLMKHITSCEHALVECTNNCGQRMARGELEAHMRDTCQRRVVSCPHCNLKIVAGQLEDHLDTCPRFPVLCPNDCSEELIPREELDQHIEQFCPKAVSPCAFKDIGCQFEGTREEVQNHLQTNMSQHLSLAMTKIKSMEDTMIKQRAEHDNLTATVTRLSEMMAGGSSSVAASPGLVNGFPTNAFTEEISKLRADLDNTNNEVKRAKVMSERNRGEVRETRLSFEEQIQTLKKQVTEHSEMINEVSARLWCGTFIWRINSFARLFEQSKSGDVPAIHSLPFYTGVPGYKMCLRVNLNGIDSGANTHVSLFVHLMIGEFDSIVQWPFPGTIHLTVMDQNVEDPKHVRETLMPRTTLQAYQRPKANRNYKGYGYVEMIPHQTLRTRNYIKEDTVVVKVEIDMPTW